MCRWFSEEAAVKSFAKARILGYEGIRCGEMPGGCCVSADAYADKRDSTLHKFSYKVPALGLGAYKGGSGIFLAEKKTAAEQGYGLDFLDTVAEYYDKVASEFTRHFSGAIKNGIGFRPLTVEGFEYEYCCSICGMDVYFSKAGRVLYVMRGGSVLYELKVVYGGWGRSVKSIYEAGVGVLGLEIRSGSGGYVIEFDLESGAMPWIMSDIAGISGKIMAV